MVLKSFTIIFSFLFLLSCAPKLAVHELIIPKPAKSRYAYSQVEPSVRINPKDTNIIVAGTVLNDFYISKDAGRTWESKILESSYGVYGDPVMDFDSNGRILYFHLASYALATHLDRIVCQSSDDLGETFTDGSFPEPEGKKVQDKQSVYVDLEENVIYMTWTQFDAYNSKDPKDSSTIVFSKSIDGGESWTAPIRISHFAGDCLDDDNTVEGAMPVMNADGELVVVWSGPKGLVCQISKDKGETWLPTEKMLYPHVGGWTFSVEGLSRANGLPVLKSDRKNNKIYLNYCAPSQEGGTPDVWLITSEDGGYNWNEPKKVNQDRGNAEQFFTWMSVDQRSGALYFVYYDRRKLDGKKTNVFAAASFDGGKRFKEIKLNSKSFEPKDDTFFGDYLAIDAVNDCIRAVYPVMVGPRISLRIALLRPENFK
jgi:Neuraminidase (sialidase)